MSSSHGQAQLPNETAINTSGVASWIIGLGLMLPLLLAGVYGFFQRVSVEEMQTKVMSAPTTELDESRQQWDDESKGYGIVERGAEGVRYRIPVDKARALVIAEARAQREAALAAAAAAAEAAAQEEALLQEGEAMDGVPAVGVEGGGDAPQE